MMQVRHMIIIIDGSTAMFDQDLRPNRFISSIQVGGTSILINKEWGKQVPLDINES